MSNAPLQARPSLTYGAIMEAGWDAIKKQFGPVVALTAVYFMGLAGLSQIPFVGWFLSCLISAGYTACLIKVREGKTFDFPDFFWAFSSFSRVLNLFLLNLLMPLILAVGLLLFLIPGIYASVPLTFASTWLVRQDSDAIEALRGSFHITKGNWWWLGGLCGLLLILNMIGALCLVIGLLVSIPLSTMMLILVIEDLTGPSDRGIPFQGETAGPSVIPVNPN